MAAPRECLPGLHQICIGYFRVNSSLDLTYQTTQGQDKNLDRSPQYEKLKEDREDGGGEEEDDEVPDGHERDGGQAGEADGGHQYSVEGDQQPLPGSYGRVDFLAIYINRSE